MFSPAHDSGSSDIVLRPGNRAKLARITFIRMFGAPEVRQLWVFATDSAPYELLSIPPPSTPMPPPPPENDGFYPKDQEREDGEKLINSSRSTRWSLGLLMRCWERSQLDDRDDEDDEGIDDFGHTTTPVHRMSWNHFVHNSQHPLGLDGMVLPKMTCV